MHGVNVKRVIRNIAIYSSVIIGALAVTPLVFNSGQALAESHFEKVIESQVIEALANKYGESFNIVEVETSSHTGEYLRYIMENTSTEEPIQFVIESNDRVLTDYYWRELHKEEIEDFIVSSVNSKLPEGIELESVDAVLTNGTESGLLDGEHDFQQVREALCWDRSIEVVEYNIKGYNLLPSYEAELHFKTSLNHAEARDYLKKELTNVLYSELLFGSFDVSFETDTGNTFNLLNTLVVSPPEKQG